MNETFTQCNCTPWSHIFSGYAVSLPFAVCIPDDNQQVMPFVRGGLRGFAKKMRRPRPQPTIQQPPEKGVQKIGPQSKARPARRGEGYGGPDLHAS